MTCVICRLKEDSLAIILVCHSSFWNNLLCFYFRSNGRPKTPLSPYHVVRVQTELNSSCCSEKYLCCVRRWSHQWFHMSKLVCQVSFRRYTLTDDTGGQQDFDYKALQALLKINPRQTTRELAAQLNCFHVTVERHLQAFGSQQVRKVGATRIVRRQQGSVSVNLCFAVLPAEPGAVFSADCSWRWKMVLLCQR